MLSKTELLVLRKLFENSMATLSIHAISKSIGLHYPQVHRTVKVLLKKQLVLEEKKGNNLLISLDFTQEHFEYLAVENQKRDDLLDKHKLLKILFRDLMSLKRVQYICILFGSYAKGKSKPKSDIDLLFILPVEYDLAGFEMRVKNALTISNVDINIVTEQNLVEMWYYPNKFNLGNEILSEHVILYGGEQFFNLRRKYYDR